MPERLLLVVALMAVSVAAHAGGNLLRNGGFEEPPGPDGSIPGWTVNDALQLQSLSLDEDAFSGERALCILSTQPTQRNSILSQTVEVVPGRDYQLTLQAKRDSFVYGTFFRVALLRGDEEVGRQQNNFRSNDTWRPVTMGFNAGEADRARVEIQTPNRGDWRITIGRRLWVDDVTLAEVDHRRNLHLDGTRSSASAEIDVTEPGHYYLWARVQCHEPTRFTLAIGDDVSRDFRAYTIGAQYWLRPVIPELLIGGGRQRIEVRAHEAGAQIERVVLTMDPFWTPDDYEPFMPPADALAAQRERGFDPVERGSVELALSAIGNLPPGRRGVSQGLTFPRGVLADPAHLRISDGRPVQAETLTRWPDGSVAWLRLSTFAEPGERLSLHYGTAIARPEAPPDLLAQRDRDAVSVDTGALSFSVPLQGPALIENLTDGERTIASITGVVNERFMTTGAREVAIEEAGPVRAAVRISGAHLDEAGEKLLDYVVRLFTCAGERHLRVEHSFVLRDDILSVEIDRLALRMETPVASATLEPGEHEVTVTTDAGEAVLQAELASEGSRACDRPWTVTQAGQSLAWGEEASGRLIARGPGQMVIDLLDFARNAPKTLAVDADGIDLGLVGGPLTFFKGMMKTHEFIIALGEDAGQVADAFEARPLLLAEPQWYCESHATGHLPMPTAESFPGYEAGIATTMRDWDNRVAQADSTIDFAGILNTGDARYSDGGNNLESALGEGAMIQFLRTGREDYFRFADLSIRHFADIDIDHSHSSGGLIYVHGPHARDRLDPGSRGVNGHSWYNGTVLYGLFTGSQRVLDTAALVGEYYSRWPFPPRDYIHYWRRLAWKLMALTRAFEVTGDPRFLEAALDDVRVTRAQQDHMVNLWPYMFAVGAKALRHYHDLTGDPGARELYLQIMDGFVHLRERPGDTVNGEWPKVPGQLLGNFPNDRSCAYYNEAAHATWLSGDERFARAAGEDLAFQIAFNVNDPTLLWGSADLIRAMSELDIPEPDLTARLPAAFMTPSSVSDGADRPTIALQVVADEDRDFAIELFKSNYRKYTHDYRGSVTVHAPDGAEVARADVRTSGLRRYRLDVPADGQTGVYTVIITIDDPWRWTLDALDFELEAGEHVVRICPRYDRLYIDAISIAPAGEYFPTLHGDPPAGALILQAEDGEMEDGYEVVEWVDALGGRAVRATSTARRDDGPWLTLRFEVAEAGTYRFFARVWKPFADLLNMRINDGEPVECKQSHDMDANAYPVWSIATTLGEDAVVMPYCDVGRFNMGAYNPENLLPHPVLAR